MARKKKDPFAEFDMVTATPTRVRELESEIKSMEKMLEIDSKRPSPKIQDVVVPVKLLVLIALCNHLLLVLVTSPHLWIQS